jgi:murein L,D-transpeptidase YafK
LAAALLCGPAAAAAPTAEQQLQAAVELLRAGQSDNALKALDALSRREPGFPVARLMHGELLAALSGSEPVAPANDGNDPRIAALAQEARVRLASEKAIPPPGTLPNAVLQLADSFQHLIVVDLPRARLYLLKNNGGQLELVRHHYSSMGKNGSRKQVSGDNRTPVGLYHITGWIDDKALPELYGAGALPLDYPNLWDRFKRRTGSGIWLHGVPRDTYTRAPLSSEGCVTMANDDLSALKPAVRFGRTPVLLSDELEWLPAAQLEAERAEFAAQVEAWREAWSSLDTERYLSWYGADFSTQGMDRKAFAAHKHRVNASKRFIEVQLRELSLFRYPGTDEPLWLAEFTQDYASDNYQVTVRKQQFWKRTAQGEWRIFREETR